MAQAAPSLRPAWAGKQRDLTRLRLPRYESAEQFPGWRILGHDDFYSCVWPAEYAPDPDALAYLRAYHPEVVPIVRRQLWHPPNTHEIVTVVHWAFGRYIWYPGHDLVTFFIEMPADADFTAPNWIDCVFEDKDPREDGPGGYWPFDMRMAKQCRRGYEEGFDQFRIEEVLRRRRERKQAALAKLLKAEAEKRAHLQRSVGRKMEGVTRSDVSDFWARKLRALGEKHARGSTRPFVTVNIGGKT